MCALAYLRICLSIRRRQAPRSSAGASGVTTPNAVIGTSMVGSSGSSEAMRSVAATFRLAVGVNVTSTVALPPTGMTNGGAGAVTVSSAGRAADRRHSR